MTNKYLSAFFLCNVVTCTELQAASSSAFQQLKKGNYEEDLALYRIAFCKPPKVAKKEPATPLLCPLDQAGHLYHRLAQRKAAYEQVNCLKGYTIQLYMGSSRTTALKIQDLASSFASFPKFHYRQPHYTVQLGFFLDRLEAYFVYLTLVKKIPTAMIRPYMCTKQDYLATIVQADDPF